MDFQCSIYDYPASNKSYLQSLKEAGVRYDYVSRGPINAASLTAHQMMCALQERTVLSIVVLDTFDRLCEIMYREAPMVRQSFKSWWDFRQWARGLFQGEGNWYHSGFRDERLDIFGILHARITNSFGEPLRSRLSKVPCGGLFTSDVSAYVASSSCGEPAVIIPWNLSFYLHLGSGLLFRYLNSFVTYTGGEDQERDRYVEKTCDETLKVLTQIATDCCDVGPRLFRIPSLLLLNLIICGPEIGEIVKEEPVSDTQIITQAGLYYVLLHELGHIALEHLKSEHYVPVLGESNNNLVLYTTTSVQEEEADQFAIRHFLTSALPLIPGPDYLKLLGPCFVFALYRFREAVFSRWRTMVLSSLKQRGIKYHIHEEHLLDGNAIKLWTGSRHHSEYIELPVHPPTRQRLTRVTGECIQYAETNKSDDWHLVVTAVLLARLADLIEHFCNEITMEGAADFYAAKSAEQMVEKIVDGTVNNSIYPTSWGTHNV